MKNISIDKKKKLKVIPAVVVGSDGPNVLAVMRSLGRKGIPVWFLSINGWTSKYSRYCKGCTSIYGLEGADLFERIKKFTEYFDTKPVLYCCSDEAIVKMFSISDYLSKHYLFITPLEQAEQFLCKWQQLSVAEKANIKYPKTVLLREEGDLDSIKSFSFPAISKPSSVMKKGDFDKKTLSFKSAIDATEVLTSILSSGSSDTEIIFQEYIPGNDNDIQFCLAVCDDDGHPVTMASGIKIRQYPTGAGIMSSGRTKKIAELEQLATAYFKAAKIKGIVGIEFKVNSASYEKEFIEISTRTENFISIAHSANIELVYHAYQQTLGKKIDEAVMRENIVWISALYDLYSAIELIYKKKYSVSDYINSLKGKIVFSEFAIDDPAPFFLSLLSLFLKKAFKGTGLI